MLITRLKTLICAAIVCGLAACGDTEQKTQVSPPSNNPHAKLAPVTFEESLAIKQPKEQQFDFYFNPNEKEDQRFSIGVEFWLPEETHFLYFADHLLSQWRKGKNVPYFYVTLEHHLTDGTVRALPLTGVKIFLGDDLLHETFHTPPARFSVFCDTAHARQDSAGKEYSGRKCHMTGVRLNEIPDYQNGFFRLKIKLAAPLKLEDFILVKAAVAYPPNHK